MRCGCVGAARGTLEGRDLFTSLRSLGSMVFRIRDGPCWVARALGHLWTSIMLRLLHADWGPPPGL